MMIRLLPRLAPIVMSALGTLTSRTGLDGGGLANKLRRESTQFGAHASAPAAPAAQDTGFGVDDLINIGGSLAKSGALGDLFK